MAEAPKSGRVGLLLYLFALLPCAIPTTMPWLCVAAVVGIALAVERFFEARTRHLGGAVYAGFLVVALLYTRGFGVPWAASAAVAPLALGGLASAVSVRSARVLRASPTTAAFTGILLVLLGYQGLFMAGALPSLTDDFLFELRADPVPAALTEGERAAAIAVVDAVLSGEDALTDEPILDAPRAGRAFVTLYLGRGRSRGVAGPGPLRRQLEQATEQALEASRRSGRFRTQPRRTAVQIDLAGEEDRLSFYGLRNAMRRGWMKLVGGRPAWRWAVYDTEPGLQGLAMRGAGREAFILPGDALSEGHFTPRSMKRRYRSHNFSDMVELLEKRTQLTLEWKARSEAELFGFRTYAFARLPNSDQVVESYRGNVLVPELPDEARMLHAIDEAGRWLLRTVEPDGRFDYEYFPSEDRHGRGYNEVRHAGSVYGLFHMAHLAKREPALEGAEDYIEAGVRALDRVYRNLGAPVGTEPAEGFVAFLEGTRGEKTNSGAAALTLLSFLERPSGEDVQDGVLAAALRRDGDEALMAGLVKTLLAMIDDEGRVYERWVQARQGGGVEKEPLYYPGEVMLALARYHAEVGSEEALAGAEAIAVNQIKKLGNSWHSPDHWVMQALEVLDRIDPEDERWAEAAYDMGGRYVKDQFPPHPAPFPDYRGAYRRVQEVPRTTRAASRGEAIGGVARIAWRRGDPSQDFERALIEGGRHLIEQQWRPENSWFLPEPGEARGAIRMGIVDTHCRIDNNQHGVVALGNALEAIRRREAR